MKRWSFLFLAVAMPLTSPLACGGDGCLRNTDCAADHTCSSGECVLKNEPAASGGEGGESLTPTAGASAIAGSGASSGKGGSAGAGGVAGTADTAGTKSDAGAGGAAGERGASGAAGEGGVSGAGGVGVGGV